MKRVYINTFDGGTANDPRDPRAVARTLTNFDAITNRHKLTPYRSSESGNDTAANALQNFAVAPVSATVFVLNALGINGSGFPRIRLKAFGSSSTNDMSDAGWETPSQHDEAAAGAALFEVFTYYAKRARIFLLKGTVRVSSYDPTTSAAFDDEGHDLSETIVTSAPALVHSKDDILYIPYNNKIATNNNNSWVDPAITFRTDSYITNIAESGNFIAVATALKGPSSGGFGTSQAYLWDRNASNTTVSESINFGEGVLKVLGMVGDALVGISLNNSANTFKGSIIFRYWIPGMASAVPFLTLENDDSNYTPLITLRKQIADNRMYFMMSLSTNGAFKEGVWSVSRTSQGGFAVVQERSYNNDTQTANTTLKGFYKLGDYLFQAANVGGTYGVTKTDNAGTYSATSLWETTINPGMQEEDKPLLKKLMSVGLNYEPLPTAGQVVLKYRVNGGSWVTVFTETTDGVGYTEPFTNAGGTQFTPGKDYEFRVESTGGAVITGLVYKYDILTSNA